jgi:hypothetical protein
MLAPRSEDCQETGTPNPRIHSPHAIDPVEKSPMRSV